MSAVDNLSDYFYFSRESRKLYSSSAEILSNEAKKLLQNLVDASDSVRSKAIESAKQLAPAEQVLLDNAMFDEIIKEEKIDSKKFKSYLELSVELKQQKEAVTRIKALPIARIPAGLVGQMTAFVKTLDASTKDSLKSFLLTNSKLNASVNAIFK